MSEISTIVRAYYDTAAEPVTASEILHPAPVAQPRSKLPSLGLPSWAVAVGVAVGLVIIIGVASLLLGGSDQFEEPGSPTDPPPVTTTLAGSDTGQLARASVWMAANAGVLLTVNPPLLPPVPGTYEVTVRGYSTGEQGEVWVTSCPGARGEVDLNAWQPAEEPGSLESMCALAEDHHVAEGDFVDGAFETMVQVEIDETAIEDGGVVITAGDIWVPVAGNVLLRIADKPETPWKQTYNDLNLTRLTGIITYWPPFVQDFNETYETLDSCDEAYNQAQAGQSGYLSALEQWDDTQRDTPGYAYDQAVAQLIAGERWLHDHTCPGRYDFTTIG